MDQKIRLVTVSSLSLLGILCISSGIMYSSLQKKNIKETAIVIVQQKRVSKKENAEIILKNFEIEVNTPLSVKIVDYLEQPVNNEILANLKLDTSSVNVTQPGIYEYSITYKKKKYSGKITVKEKQLPQNSIQSITLKTINIKKGTVLPTDISYYIIENVPDELKSTMKLNISDVNVNIAATYQYTITYNNSIYTSNIIVTEDQQILSSPIDLKLKSFEVEVGSQLSSNVKDYLENTISDSDLSNLKLDISKVDLTKEGIYQYTILYEGKSYSGNITVKKKETNP